MDDKLILLITNPEEEEEDRSRGIRDGWDDHKRQGLTTTSPSHSNTGNELKSHGHNTRGGQSPLYRPLRAVIALTLIISTAFLVTTHQRLPFKLSSTPGSVLESVISRYSSSSDCHGSSGTDSHDYNKYVWHKKLLPDWRPDSGHRIIAIGDTHGMVDTLKNLLFKLNYEPSSDTVLLLGDLAAKHPSIDESLRTIEFCRKSNLISIRGNHDQYIIIWRNWMDVHRHRFVPLDQQRSSSFADDDDDHRTLEQDQWLLSDRPPSPAIGLKLPEGMKWKSQHFEIARRLPRIDLKYLISLSLTIYIHPLRTYFVHAGMLPWELVEESGPQEQNERENDGHHKKKATSILSLRENRDPLTLLEMRGVKKGRKPTKSKTKGKPWFKKWNKIMKICASGQKSEANEEGSCAGRGAYQVVYGHWASKGLTIKPWSIGLDSGCVYGRSLSALVIGGKPDGDHSSNSLLKHHKDHKGSQEYPVQINNFNATVVSLSCPKPS